MRPRRATGEVRSKAPLSGVMPVPTGGWDASSPLGEMKPDSAIELVNWIPRPGYIEVRKGYNRFAVDGRDTVESLLPYEGGSTTEMFAASGSRIWSTDGETADITGLTNAKWEHTSITTAGGQFLWICNGVDAPRHFNGTVWATPTITGVDETQISDVTVYKRRIWGILNGTMTACYLDLDSIAGAAVEFPLGAVASRGGALLAVDTWTIPSGSDVTEYLVFITTMGEALIYSGIDPTDADNFRLMGRFRLGAPLGRRCLTSIAGDLAYISVDGVLPLAKAISIDRGVAQRVSLTEKIASAMNTAAQSYSGNFGWQLMGYPRGTLAILNVPIVEGEESEQYVMNTLTGAWCRFTNMPAACWALYNDKPYFGGPIGRVYEFDVGALDDGTEIEAYGATAFSAFGSGALIKQFQMIQPQISSSAGDLPGVSIAVDYLDPTYPEPAGRASVPGGLWDVSNWDEGVFADDLIVSQRWQSVHAVGRVGSVTFKATTTATIGARWDGFSWDNGTWGPDSIEPSIVRINRFVLTMEKGGLL